MLHKLLVLLVLYALFPSYAYAQSANRLDITVSPISLDITGQPGITVQNRIRVHNNGSTPLHLSVSLKKIVPADTDPGFQLVDPTPQDEFISWIHIETPRFEAPPQEWVYIPFSISIPSNAAFGYYPAFVINQEASPSSGTAVLSGGVAVLTALNVLSPNAHVESDLLDFSASSQITEWLPVTFFATIKNKGNIHVRPRGNIFISSGEKNDIDILEVNLDQSTIIPGSTRTFTSSWTNGFITKEKDESGRERFVIHWEKITNMRIGKYTARLLLVYDAGTRDATLEAITTFWVVPWKLLLILLTLLLVIIISIRLLFRWYVRRLLKKQEYGAR